MKESFQPFEVITHVGSSCRNLCRPRGTIVTLMHESLFSKTVARPKLVQIIFKDNLHKNKIIIIIKACNQVPRDENKIGSLESNILSYIKKPMRHSRISCKGGISKLSLKETNININNSCLLSLLRGMSFLKR